MLQRSRRPRSAVLVAVLAALAISFPLGAIAIHQFGDVPDANVFHGDIDALVDSGVTSGCGGGNYCPSANVTREQMAAFLNRLGALAPGKTPVVNAKSAQDADNLDGLDSTAFLQAGTIVDGYGAGLYRLATSIAGTFTTAYDFGAFNVQRTDAGDARVVADPRTPRTQNGIEYRLTTVRYCATSLSASSLIGAVSVFAYDNDTTNSLAYGATDATDRVVDGCYTADFSASSVPADLVEFVVAPTFTAGGDHVTLSGITFTWTPVMP